MATIPKADAKKITINIIPPDETPSSYPLVRQRAIREIHDMSFYRTFSPEKLNEMVQELKDSIKK